MTGHTRLLRVSLLADSPISWDGTVLQPRTSKGLALLCFLARQSKAVSRGTLATLLWPDSHARLGNLRWELHQLRQLAGSNEWLRTDPESVTVLATTDFHELEQAMELQDYATVLRLTAGSLLIRLNLNLPAINEWLTEERELVASWRRSALIQEARRLEAASQASEALELIREALKSDPLDETAHRTAMRLALKQGDLTAARAQFEACRRILASEFGLEPTTETLELAAAIETAVRVNPTARAGSGLPPALLHPPRLIGRERAWSQLQDAWDRNQLIFISGPQGSGKTRLAQDFIRAQVAAQAVTVLRGFASDVDTPFSTYARGWRIALERQPELLQQLPTWVQDEAAHYLPELFAGAQPGNHSEGHHLQQVRALNELYRRHLQGYAAALVDDTQFFDASSWHLAGMVLQELIEGESDLECRIIITFRDDGMLRVLVPHLRSLVARGRATHIELAELTEQDLSELLHSLGRPVTEAARFRELAGRNPFCILEILRFLHANPELTLTMPARRLLPDSIREMNRARLARVSLPALQIAVVLATHGEQSEISQLAGLAGIDPVEAAEAVVELQKHGLATDFCLADEFLRETLLLGVSAH